MTTRKRDESSGKTPEIIISLPQQSRRDLELCRHESSATELDVVISGQTVLMSLPFKTLAAVSKLVSGMWEKNQLILCGGRFKLLWRHDTSNVVDKESLLKVLKFCCGETVAVGVKNGECCAVIAALFRLDVWCAKTVVTELCNFAEEQARRNVAFGAALLKASSRYPECCDQQLCALDTRLAKIVLTKERICNNYQVVVDECLMALGPRYLEITEYGKPRTRWSEFTLRTRYIRYHKSLNAQEKERIMRCNMGSMAKDELDVLEELGVLKPDTVMSLYGSPLVEAEKSKSESIEASRFQQQSKSCDWFSC